MNSAPSNYSECKFSAISDTFKKSLSQGRVFYHVWGQKMPPRGNYNFLAHSTDAKSLRAIISNIFEKIIKNLMRGFEDIGSKGHFLAKRGVPRAYTNFFLGQINIQNEFSTINYSECKVSAKSDNF